ncbi:hypothetical protein DSM106972_037970 [Dulcicalothrix desertica PCC 7102]|uniref:PEP-CTERM protein-sorting domain-containing protein n=1 Tax=Dulcicalothrix desertica PCC 7102 TaxID=232991 RepID=A0A3S1AN96_9CYAN|nr:hypothetical protein [Dulcicalothrix desertica]RUT04976.1 hypothetical protein DSM106972_037970 [Dulcicalothrix desertica PCC 7102]TWH43457.1 hypothetical protein CAL7102_07180 [Dulcicalothrix desertica PCC 7102]
MTKNTHKIVGIAANAVLLTLCIIPRAQAYQLFTDRNSWNNATQNQPLVTEQFNEEDFVTPNTVFDSGLRYVDSGFLGGARVSQGSLEVGLGFPGSLEEFAFPNPVKGFSFNFEVKKGTFAIEDTRSFGSVNLGSFGDSGFFGVLASNEEAPILGFRTVSSGEIGSNVIRNLSFTQTDTVTKVPEYSSTFALGILGLGLLFHKKMLPKLRNI